MVKVKVLSEVIEEIVPHYKSRADKVKKNLLDNVPVAEHTLIYDSSSETLEPIYFFILDLMNEMGLNTEKYVDNFVSTPGSGHFQELGMRASTMQQQASNLLGAVNNVVKSVLNLVFDLKDIRIRLEHYDELNSKDKASQEAAQLSLKQIWMDKVDILKGNSSIKAMALGQAGFQTLLHAFLVVNDAKLKDSKGNEIDIGDVIKRILRPRIQEFIIWVDNSEKELRKRYKIQRSYLKSQVETLKLYSRWAKPYLRAANQLEMKESGRSADLVKVFNTILLELTLLGKSKIKVKDAAIAGDLPSDFSKENFIKTLKKDYYSCILVDFKFRGIPSRLPTQQSHYSFGGRTEITFKAYALNQDEIDKIGQELEESELGDILGLVEGTTTESLDQMHEEIKMFLDEEEEEKGNVQKNSPKEQSNPFVALVGGYEGFYDKKKSKDEKKDDDKKDSKEIILKKDDWAEKAIRALAEEKAEKTVFDIFDVYKKAHSMPSYT